MQSDESQDDLILKKIHKRIESLCCPLCRSFEFDLDREHVTTVRYSPKEGQSKESKPLVQLICSSCCLILFFSIEDLMRS